MYCRRLVVPLMKNLRQRWLTCCWNDGHITDPIINKFKSNTVVWQIP
jgi:hypothetical protein